MSAPRKSALGFIIVTVLFDVTGIGIIVPVMPKLINELTGGTMSDAARWGGWMVFAYALMEFVSSPLMGVLSDRFGRRPVLLASLFGFGIDYRSWPSPDRTPRWRSSTGSANSGVLIAAAAPPHSG